MCSPDAPAWSTGESRTRLLWLQRFSIVATTSWFAAPAIALWYLFAPLSGWPLNDDPFYAKPLATWSQTGQIQFVRQYGYLTASSVAHIFTGAVATSVGFHYRSLYLVCIAQQALGAAALVWFARRLQLSPSIAAMAAACFGSYPLYFGHAFTFMTDGPAAAWSSLACVLVSLGLIQRQRTMIAVGAAAIGWGYWIRQTNGALLFGPGVALATMLTTQRLRWQAPSLAWPLALAIAMMAVLESGWFLPASFTRLSDIAPQPASGYWKRTLIALYGWLLLAGWYLLPLAPWFITQARQRSLTCMSAEKRFCLVGAGLVLLGGLLPLIVTSGRAHLTNATGSFIQNGHFGPIFLSDMDEPGRWGTLAGVAWPIWFWKLLTLLSFVSSAAFGWWVSWTIFQFVKRWPISVACPRLRFALAWLVMVALSVSALTFLVEPHLDRYWLFLMPVLTVICLLLAAENQWKLDRMSMVWAITCIALQLVMSTVFVHDMLAWNNVRWQFVSNHLTAGHAPETIDAGRDVNAWLRMDEDPDTSARNGDESRWWSGRAVICIASGPRPGWQLRSQLPWQSWATGQTHYLLVLQRSSPSG